MLASVSDADMEDIITKLVELAKDGDVSAAKLLFDRVFGKPTTGPQTPSVAIQQNFASESPGDGKRLAQAIVERIRAERQSR